MNREKKEILSIASGSRVQSSLTVEQHTDLNKAHITYTRHRTCHYSSSPSSSLASKC